MKIQNVIEFNEESITKIKELENNNFLMKELNHKLEKTKNELEQQLRIINEKYNIEFDKRRIFESSKQSNHNKFDVLTKMVKNLYNEQSVIRADQRYLYDSIRLFYNNY